jgi:hypothetical protein
MLLSKLIKNCTTNEKGLEYYPQTSSYFFSAFNLAKANLILISSVKSISLSTISILTSSGRQRPT